MIKIGLVSRLAAVAAALGVNFAMTGGLVALALHYDAHAAPPTVLATQQCRHERAGRG